eukprot:GILK01011767.1.p1 GENE.GILK01011767.1~~GILK01011767.1.p1  ORF type:complete len:248 (+),score=18.64 GILK01011767.1:65-808(+)
MFARIGLLLTILLSATRTMAWRSHGSNNQELVDNLRRHHIIKSVEVERAMKAIDRAKYSGSGAGESAYLDMPRPIGYAATISAPHMHAAALEILRERLHPGAKVLDVGSGSGYLTACMALMVGPTGKAIGIEHIPDLVSKSLRNVRSDHPELLDSGRLVLQVGDGRLGVPEEAPFDAIHVGAAAAEMPSALIEQLAPGGVMVIPVGPQHGAQSLMRIEKTAEGQVKMSDLMGVMYVPLTNAEDQIGA